MTIEVNRRDSKYTYRVNPYNSCMIDRRVNRHGAKWEWYATRATADDTRKYLLQLEKESKEQAK